MSSSSKYFALLFILCGLLGIFIVDMRKNVINKIIINNNIFNEKFTKKYINIIKLCSILIHIILILLTLININYKTTFNYKLLLINIIICICVLILYKIYINLLTIKDYYIL